MSSVPRVAEREGTAETVAGFLATLAIFGGLIGIVERPVTVGLASLFIAFVAAAMAAGRHRRLAAAAVAIAGASWLTGMIVAVLTSRPLW